MEENQTTHSFLRFTDVGQTSRKELRNYFGEKLFTTFFHKSNQKLLWRAANKVEEKIFEIFHFTSCKHKRCSKLLEKRNFHKRKKNSSDLKEKNTKADSYISFTCFIYVCDLHVLCTCVIYIFYLHISITYFIYVCTNLQKRQYVNTKFNEWVLTLDKWLKILFCSKIFKICAAQDVLCEILEENFATVKDGGSLWRSVSFSFSTVAISAKFSIKRSNNCLDTQTKEHAKDYTVRKKL